MKKFVCLFVCLFAGSVNAGLITNFNAVYDTNLGQLSYSFDLTSVDSTSTAGINQLYFNYNPEVNPFNSSSSILFSTSTGNSITYEAGDEFAIMFDTLLNSNAINFNITFDNITTSELSSWDSFEIYINPTFLSGSLTGQSDYSYGVGTHSNGTIGSIPEPASLALLGLGLAGIGFSRKKKTR